MRKWMEGINVEGMEKWIADLRSGNFVQGEGLLHRASGEMCCLGVATYTNAEACDIVRVLDEESYRYRYVDVNGNSTGALMPVGVINLLGIPRRFHDAGAYDGAILVFADMENEEEQYLSTNRQEIDGKPVISVISLNDSLEKSFAEIADRIESTFSVEVPKYVDGINEENMDKFLAALRSGEFKQAKYALQIKGVGFCCMGVMSELAFEDGAVSKKETEFEVTYGGVGNLPTAETLDWLGIPEKNRFKVNPLINSYNIKLFHSGITPTSSSGYITPSEINDSMGMSFGKIADLFEHEFLRKEN